MAGRAAKPIRAALAAGALLGLTGCAVMQIDVDVYKGPLANHEDVQVQQMAALAVGAKPLLTQLRDIIEWKDKASRTAERQKDGYSPGYMNSDRFKKDQAARVNAVLSLYEDKVDEPLLELALNKIQLSKNKYFAANKILSPDIEGDKNTWEKIVSGFLNAEFQDLDTQFQNQEHQFWRRRQNCENKIRYLKDKGDSKKLAALAHEFRRMLYPTAGNDRWREVSCIAEIGNLLSLKVGQYDPSTEPFKIYIPTNGRFSDLADRETVGRYRKRLFKDPDGDQAKLFEDRVVAIAGSFLNGRSALRELWIELNDMLILINTEGTNGDRLVQIPSARRHAITSVLADNIALLVQHRRLAFAMAPKQPAEIVELKKTLASAAPPKFWEIGKGRKRVADWGRASYEIGDRIVARAIRYDPVRVAQLFLATDAAFTSANVEQLPDVDSDIDTDNKRLETTKYLDRFGPEIARLFGFIRAPGFAVGQVDSTTVISGVATVEAATSALGLERGRLPEGLYTLTENYLDHMANPVRNIVPGQCQGPQLCDSQTEAIRNLLLDSLVRFSEKVLVIANNSQLLSPDRSLPEDMGESKGSELNHYVLVLQAVGNSIMIQANELRFREEHKKKQKAAKGRELLGVGLAYSSDPRVVLDGLALVVGGKSDVLATTDTAYQTKVTKLGQRKQALEGKLPVFVNKLASFKTALDTAQNHYAGALVLHTRRDLASLFIDKSPAHSATAPNIPGVPSNLLAAFRAGINTIVSKQDPAMLPPSAWPDLQHKIDNLFAHTVNAQSVVTEQANIQLLANAQSGFAEIKAAQVTDPKRSKAFDQLRTALGDQSQSASTDLSAKAKLLVTSKTDLTKAKIPVEKLKAQIAEVKKTLKQTKADRSLATELRHTLAAIKEYSAEAIKEVRKKLLPITAKNTIRELLVLFEHDKAQPAKTTQLTDAIKHVDLYRVPMAAPMSPTTEPQSARDVLDDVIAALRHEHIKVVSQVGPNAKRSKDIAAALKVAYEQRAGMAYIRPSAAYLRSSYPSTSLQDDPGLAWRNMLAGHALRSVPFIGGALVNPSSDAEKRKIVREIDKQFWQTINRVRVAGAGDTNYVIAKDDIGNWYVKAFSADPKKIIKSVQKLALFNLGAQLDTNLLSRLDAKDGEAPEDVSKPSLQRLFEEFEKDYAEKTGKDFAGLKSRIEEAGLKTSIKKAWSGIENVETYFERAKIESDLAVNFNTLQETKFEETETAKQSSKILSAASAVLRFHGNLARAIGERNFANKPTFDLEKKNFELKTANGELATSQAELERRRKERDAADQTVRDLLRADPFSKEALKAAQDDRDEKDAAVQDQEKEVNKKKTAVRAAETAVATARENLKKVQDAERRALAALQRVVRDELIKLTTRRNQTVKTFETGVLFIGKATKPAAKPKSKPTPAPTATVPGNGG